MKEFPFDNRAVTQSINGKKTAVRGAIELYPDFQQQGILSLDIKGPGGALIGAAFIDRETARRVGAALSEWGWR
jgi:hypothetical protein